jgi:hypothetical protein
MKTLQPTLLLILVCGLCSPSLSQEILADEIQIACGNRYFSEVDEFRQAALVVRGIFCGDAYMWTFISEGDALQEVAYRGDELFTGICIDLDTAGVLIGRYTFKDGLLQKLEEFHENGQVYKILNYTDGIPNGPSIRITDKGLLDSFFFFDQGVRSGAYYLTRDRTDWGLPPCIEYGVYNNGESAQLTKPCFEGD